MKPEAPSEAGQARKVALDALARRECSEVELTRKLASRGYDSELIEEILSGLVAEGLLDNLRFAEAFIHARFQRGSGPQKIRAELRARGIGDELIDACLDEYEAQWQARIRQVREKRFGAAQPTDFRERSRQMRFLQQRGFTSEQISGVFRDADE